MSHTLSAYRVAPQMEFKAAQELREAGIRAYVPRDRDAKRRPPLARGYVFSGSKPAFSKHVRSKVGETSSAELARLYLARMKAITPDPLRIGDLIRITVGPFKDHTGPIVAERGRKAWSVDLSTHSMGTVTVITANMIRIDPG